MKTAFTKLLRSMRKAGHPVLWAALFAALYGTAHYRDRLYWETPSIPFRPFCNPKSDAEFLRPVRGNIELSDAFLEYAAKEMTGIGFTIKATLFNTFKDKTPGSHFEPLLVAPKDFDDISMMTDVSETALFATRGVPTYLDSDKAKATYGVSITCEDIEGKITKF